MKERLPLVLVVAASIVWAAVVVFYLLQLSWAGFLALDPAGVGALLAAAAGPIAALWLILVVLEQRRDARVLTQRFAELAQQERRSQSQVESLARAVGEVQGQQTRAVAIETRRLALQDLAASTAVLAERLGVVKRDAAGAAWARFGAGDFSVFVQAFLNFAGSHPDIAERVGEAATRDPVARAALAGFVRRYEQIANSITDDKLLTSVIEEGALGRGYRLFKQADSIAAAAEGPLATPDEQADVLRDRLDGLSRRLETADAET